MKYINILSFKYINTHKLIFFTYLTLLIMVLEVPKKVKEKYNNFRAEYNCQCIKTN